MLSRNVPAGARILQLGGDVKQLYYYPSDTILVSVAAPKLNKGLWEQAGVQAGVPVLVQQSEELAQLPFQVSTRARRTPPRAAGPRQCCAAGLRQCHCCRQTGV